MPDLRHEVTHTYSFIEKAFWALLSAMGAGALVLLGLAVDYMSDMSRSVQLLNANVAVVIERVANHDLEIDRMGERVGDLERDKAARERPRLKR